MPVGDIEKRKKKKKQKKLPTKIRYIQLPRPGKFSAFNIDA
jgi:hypothetical protein